MYVEEFSLFGIGVRYSEIVVVVVEVNVTPGAGETGTGLVRAEVSGGADEHGCYGARRLFAWS